jgi:hypothetical protein
LHELIQESPELHLDKISSWLALYHEVQISTTALHDNLPELMHHVATEGDYLARMAGLSSEIWLCTIWSVVITLLLPFLWTGEYANSILPALTIDGYTAVRTVTVEGSINGEELFDFIVNDLVCLFFQIS